MLQRFASSFVYGGMQESENCLSLSDGDLIARLKTMVVHERQFLIILLVYLAEVDRRRLYANEGYSSLFVFCVRELRYSEGAAARRVYTARAAKRFPAIYSLLSEGRLSMSAVSRLATYLTEENHEHLLSQAEGRSTRDLEKLLASLAPRNDIADRIRHISAIAPQPPEVHKLVGANVEETPSLQTNEVAFKPAVQDKILPLAPQRIQISFTASEEFLSNIERVKQILWHKHPAGRLEDLFHEVVIVFLEKKDPDRRFERNRFSKRKINSTRATRRIPQWVKDIVWKREEGKCSFVGSTGHRCEERSGLEYDHIVPWARGGSSVAPNNIRLLCRGHNQFAARRIFGDDACKRRRA